MKMRSVLFLLVLLLPGMAWPVSTLAVQPDEVLSDPALEARARALSSLIRCPVCQGESIDESNAGIARDLRLVLRERLVARGQDAPEVIEGRLAAARGELAEAPKYQYVIINQDFAVALSQLVAIFDCARLRFPKQQARHPALFQQLFGPGAAADR